MENPNVKRSPPNSTPKQRRPTLNQKTNTFSTRFISQIPLPLQWKVAAFLQGLIYTLLLSQGSKETSTVKSYTFPSEEVQAMKIFKTLWMNLPSLQQKIRVVFSIWFGRRPLFSPCSVLLEKMGASSKPPFIYAVTKLDISWLLPPFLGQGHSSWPYVVSNKDVFTEKMQCFLALLKLAHSARLRVEPLICKEYVGKRPVIVPYHKGGKRLHIGLQDFTEDVAAHSQAIMNRMSSVRDKVLTVCQSRKEGLEEEADNVKEKEKSYGSIMTEQLTGSEKGRIDHVLQDKTFQHAYISAIGSHTNYWRDYDTALFMLKHLYEEIPEQLTASHQGNLISAANTIDLTDEEFPLTSSEGSLFRRSFKKSRWGFRGAS